MGKNQEVKTLAQILIAQAPPEALIASAQKVDEAGVEKIYDALKDFAPHDSGKIAEIVYGGEANSRSRGKMRKLIQDMNQKVLEGKGEFPALFVFCPEHGKYQLKLAENAGAAETFDREQFHPKKPVKK